MSFDRAEQIADAAMHEGYMLYPYRPSALKNRYRWQFGVVVPRAYNEVEGSERWFTQTECLAELGARAALTIKVRFLQIQSRTIEIRSGESWCPTDAATVDGDELTRWDEALDRALVVAVPVPAAGDREFPLNVSGGRDVELKHDAAGRETARVVRERWPISGRIVAGVEARGAIWKVTVRVENHTPCPGVADRTTALRQSLVGAHTLLAVEDGGFLSMQDPPPEAREAARSCVNVGGWPVLAGSDGSRDVMLSSPIIMSDYPSIAPESTGNLFDATEIDELLTLRVMTLTDGEKREARAADERTRRLVERTDSTSVDALLRLHGAVRDADPIRFGTTAHGPRLPTNEQDWEALVNPPSEPAPERASIDIPGARVSRGSRVRLNPQRRSDPLDMFLGGRVATVMGVYRTLEDQPYVAVTVDGDPGADLRRTTGRYFYFSADEIVALEPNADDR